MRRLGFLVHDVLAHPICGLLWIVGLERLGDWLHELTVFNANREDELWPPPMFTLRPLTKDDLDHFVRMAQEDEHE